MKRRKALKKIGLGISMGLGMPYYLASCNDFVGLPEIQYDDTVVIIGAGAAGLYTANILRSKGIRVTVLEASSRLGGRINSFERFNDSILTSDFPIELGADIIYGSDSILAVNLARRGIPVVNLGNTSSSQFVVGNQSKSASDWGTDAEFTASQNFFNQLPGYTQSFGTVESAISGLSSDFRQLLNSQIGNVYGTSNDRLGISGLGTNLGLREYNEELLILKGNFMQDFLFSRFHADHYPILFNAPVKAIDYGSSDIIDITYGEDKHVQADRVVVTVPISILKSSQIAFTPNLPASKTSSMEKIDMDPSIRVILEFKKNFWGESTNFIWGLASAPQCLSIGVGREENMPTTLSITINGPKAAELGLLEQNMVNQIIAELDEVYSGKATEFLRKDINTQQPISVIKDWSKEAYIQGGYAYPKPGASVDDYASLGAPINNKLFFAGEATDVKGYLGTVNGALNSAERVSEEVINSIIT